MKISFDLRGCGLGNNGGSSTIIHSANTLIDLGHDIFILDSFKNQHTWTKFKGNHIIVKSNKDIPNCKAIIATGYKTVKYTLSIPKSFGLKAHWIRGWETWQMSEKDIINNVLNTPTLKIVNSICLHKKLKSYNINSHIIRPGYDFDKTYIRSKYNDNKNLIIGGLYNTRHNSKRTDWIFKCISELKRKRKNVKLWMFGTNKKPINNLKIDNYICQPNLKEKNNFYRKIDIWLAPTENEGLHMPSAEAMLNGCCVIGTNSKMSGMEDYLINNVTGIVSDNNFDLFFKEVYKLIQNPEDIQKFGFFGQEYIKNFIGDRKTNMKKFIKLLEKGR